MATVTSLTPAIGANATVSDYLDQDAASDRRFEFIDGEVREMTGASREHGLLAFRIDGLLFRDLDPARFEAFLNDMRVRVDAAGPYYYPDVVVAPSPSEIVRNRGDTLLNPIAVFEILSPSTEGTDRGEKLAGYANIPTLVDYMLVAQDGCRVDHYSRQSDGSWRLVILDALDARLSPVSLGIDVSLGEIYDRVLPGQSDG